MQKLQCSSCGANLELPEGLTIAHCMYCGAKIVLRGETVFNEMVNLKRFSELAQVALQAKNYEDAVKYSSMVLEIDTKNVDAWIMKAQATFWLSTARDDKFETAMQYFETALRFNPADTRIVESQSRLRITYASWLNERGLDALNYARKTLDRWEDPLRAREESNSEFTESMKLFLNAANYEPDNLEYLQNLYICVSEAHWIPWSPSVKEKIPIIARLNQKETAQRNIEKNQEIKKQNRERIEQNIARIEQNLQQIKARVKALEGKNGFWDRAKRGDLQEDVIALEKKLKEEKASLGE